ncbi:membrane-bound alkaline phosphatase-like [Adelges cooleyi]|uniref:membrane-bound alkaline phosphatase-like n=1 Tax=Adelges cooleyi TaxID=133065 RepID=UPI00217F4C8F|nr:membrane-bound alkaline phosphatase-like [Adelges cooleyi]
MWAHAVWFLTALQVLAAVTDINAFTESDILYWRQNAKKLVEEKETLTLRTNTAKNLIIFMGDGMSVPTLTAARIYKGQLKNETGESDHLSFERFPFTGMSKTYCVDKQVPDSACTATAYLCGVKANRGTIGVTSKVLRKDCPAAAADNRPESIMQWAQWAGKATGIVTTTRVTHASPAGAYAHSAERDWESDSDMLKHANITSIKECEDIALQLITRDPGRNFKVIMGGGRDKFLMKKVNTTNERLSEDLVVRWQNDKEERFKGKTAKYMTNRGELLSADVSKIDYLLGLFQEQHMDYRLKSDVNKQPTLQEMTRKAIELLQKEENGFVLFVEGGLIDIAHHEKYAKLALDETVELSKAVSEAVSLTSEDDTLIVVTSDHAHTMSMAGYPNRGASILGLGGKLAKDGKPYTTLSYANGPETEKGSTDHSRTNLTEVDFENVDFRYPSLVPLSSETHGGDDVMVFARGPWAHLFTGNYEQNTIPLAMATAAKISTESQKSKKESTTSLGQISADALNTLIASMLIVLFGIHLSNA